MLFQDQRVIPEKFLIQTQSSMHESLWSALLTYIEQSQVTLPDAFKLLQLAPFTLSRILSSIDDLSSVEHMNYGHETLFTKLFYVDIDNKTKTLLSPKRYRSKLWADLNYIIQTKDNNDQINLWLITQALSLISFASHYSRPFLAPSESDFYKECITRGLSLGIPTEITAIAKQTLYFLINHSTSCFALSANSYSPEPLTELSYIITKNEAYLSTKDILALRTSLAEMILPIPESQSLQIIHVLETLQARIPCTISSHDNYSIAEKTELASWFRKSAQRDILAALNASTLSAFEKTQQCESYVIASHLKHLIGRVECGLISPVMQHLLIQILNGIMTVDTIQDVKRILGYEATRATILKKYFGLIHEMLKLQQKTIIKVKDIARVIPVGVLYGSDGDDLKELGISVQKWTDCLAKLLVNGDVFFD